MIERLTNGEQIPRVAAYVRVSTTLDTQEESYENQVEYYEQRIRSNPTWEFAGIYSDQESGTSANRPGLQKLLADAKDGKINIILTKSVSRWARNAMDAMETIRILDRYNVQVVFEQEGMNSKMPGFLMQLSLAASIAQKESESISENLRWVYMQRAQMGVFTPHKGMYFGFNTDHGEFNEDENSDWVRFIFNAFVNGKTTEEIAEILNERGVRNGRGNLWTAMGIKGILKNEVYTGDVHLYKRKPKSRFTGETVDVPETYLKNHHKGLIDRDTWDKAQNILKMAGAEARTGERT